MTLASLVAFIFGKIRRRGRGSLEEADLYHNTSAYYNTE
jgi:hypothetical protein